MAETIVSKSYKIATDSSGNNWDKVSMWKVADDVKGSDNATSLESTVGNIKGIANNLTTTEEGFALDARQGAALAAMFGGLTFGLGIPEGGEEEVWGYTTPDGTFVPFGGIEEMTLTTINQIPMNGNYTLTQDYHVVVVESWSGSTPSITNQSNYVTSTVIQSGNSRSNQTLVVLEAKAGEVISVSPYGTIFMIN